MNESQENENSSESSSFLEPSSFDSLKNEEPLESEDTTQNTRSKWYILQVYAGHENRVEKLIQKKLEVAGLKKMVEEIFVPSEEITVHNNGKPKKIQKKYFPGYLFIKMELTSEVWHVLKNVDRVSGFVGGSQKEPHVLEERELKVIRQQISDGFQQTTQTPELALGQKVTITEGPFNNFNGIIDEIDFERSKVKVLVSIFGRPTPVEIDFEKVKQIS